MSEQTKIGTGKIYGKILYETSRLVYVMVEVSTQIMVSMIIDKQEKAVIGAGTSRREAFQKARDYAANDRKLLEEIEDLDLE